ncbi:TetR/AcrR family transcriptional regulator [Saccharococcus caldoxylosilyticus]|uniref:Putative Na(+)/H(+) antiporter n=1 Tax=Parageobacillus caldoxylosilyticus NBRC 107762 TaxID=1220594 RepID=A0A023DKJ1_9BACL|nr:TetR/AcrR family transcriptional regulator [Parageobacillus caldoxylosilyticus]MBB3854316.1 AcrR family transcriptional regulator [Parageobacillus caldoxylosilyticus]GAJ41536.1 putative Na(+)/H(+) antiporter [Parageobacillus caldoxylosilyticus NBRC 107762]
MYSAFEKQPQEKKDLIIKVAIEEFVKNGYEKASTDVITKRAGISKGLLFHYFRSKKNLYLYLVNYVKDFLTEIAMEELKKIQSDDFFERIKEIVLLKQKLTVQYLQETQFITDAFINPPVAVKEEMEEIIKKYYEAYQEDFLLEHVYIKDLIQTEKLREDISVDTVIRMTMFIAEQLSNKYLALYKNKQIDIINMTESVIRELNDYLKIVKYGIYKSE